MLYRTHGRPRLSPEKNRRPVSLRVSSPMTSTVLPALATLGFRYGAERAGILIVMAAAVAAWFLIYSVVESLVSP
jgi:hypothetical protein